MTRLSIVILALAACGKGDAGTSGGGGGESVELNAGGSSFQKQFQENAIAAFKKSNGNVKINYSAGGSGKGRQNFAKQVDDFDCTDAPYKDSEVADVKGGDFFYIPNVLGAVAIAYNLEGVDKLQLSPATIAKIFQRDIKKWNDPAIAADNPGVTLPDQDIVVVHRSDGSGTTENFTKYLDKASGGVWTLKSGGTVQWPADTQAGNQNGGVAQAVKGAKGAIGYIDLPDALAAKLPYAAIKNQAGQYVVPTAESVSAAGEGIDVDGKLLFSAVDAKGEKSYPITMQSWCMVYAKQTDKAKGAAVKAYFKYMLTDGQKLLAGIHFAPVPKSLADKALAQIDKIQVP